MGISSKTLVGKALNFGGMTKFNETLGITKSSDSSSVSAATTLVTPSTQSVSTNQAYQDLARARARRTSFLSSVYAAGGSQSSLGGQSSKLGS